VNTGIRDFGLVVVRLHFHLYCAYFQSNQKKTIEAVLNSLSLYTYTDVSN